MTYDGSEMRMYLNGVLDIVYEREQGDMPGNESAFRIGSDVSYNDTPLGAVDEVRLWDVARSESQIAASMSTPITSPQAGLVAVWPLDGSGEDVVGGFDGTLNGDAEFSSDVPPIDTCIYEYWFATSAHADGLLSSVWVTDLNLLNRNSEMTRVDIYLHERGHNNSNAESASFELDPQEDLGIDDVIGTAFGGENVAAALRVCSDHVLEGVSRTYNRGSKGTFGQGIRLVPEGQAQMYSGYLVGLTENGEFYWCQRSQSQCHGRRRHAVADRQQPGVTAGYQIRVRYIA